jgi:hypothetical protein
MADKSPRRHSGKTKPGKSLKQKRATKKLKRNKARSPFQTNDPPR